MNKLNELFSDGDGQPSMIRVLTMMVVVTVVGVWAALSIKAGRMLPLDWSQVGLVGGAFGFKALQSFAENGNSSHEDTKGTKISDIPKSTSGFISNRLYLPLGIATTVVLFLVVLFTGCASTPTSMIHPIGPEPEPTTNGVSASVSSASVNWDFVANTLATLAAGASVAAEMYDSNSVEYLRAADTVLTVALADKSFDPTALKSTLSNISVNELHDTAAQAAILAAISIYEVNWQKMVAAKIDASPFAEKLLTSLRDGIEAGIGKE